MNSEETEQLAGRSRSRLPPFGRRYAKPPAAALLTGQVARELASTLTRLRLVRSSHLPWPWRASCRIPGHHGATGGGASLTALANGLELGFVVPRQALSGMGGDFSEPATRRFWISWLLPGRSDRSQDWDPHVDHGGAITKLVRRPSPPMGQSMRSVLQGGGAVGSSSGRREHRSCHF